MCGIGAIVKNVDDSLSSQTVRNFNAAISHRGPDGEGINFFDAEGNESEDWRTALTHRRLSIIDLSDLGKQPMSYASGKYWIIFNGEIYNYVELRSELQRNGYAFQGTSDTEVILAAYMAWGVSCFERLRGMWAIILFDVTSHKLVVCRDRMGIKPLYYFRGMGYLAFASEIKQFVSLPDFNPLANEAVIKQYLMTGFERTDQTFFKEVQPVLPGTFIEVDVQSLTLSDPVSFWTPEKITSTVTDITEASSIFSDALSESVRIHLRSDVPVGCQLSGGLDSSSVFYWMREHYTGQVIHSFTVAFPGFEKDETPFVQKMLAGSNAVSHFVTPEHDDFVRDLRQFIWHHDEPVGSFAHYAGYLLAKLIGEAKIKVVLNGQGGDEILGGYWQQYFTYLFSLAKRFQAGSVLNHLMGALSKGGNEALFSQVPATIRRYRSRKRKEPFQFSHKFSSIPSLHFFNDYFEMDDRERRVFEIRNLILPRLLKWDDRNLMAFGVEGRYPFLDHKVIETALSFDSSILFHHGWTKYPLRMSMKNRIPSSIYFRKSKWGFETPQQDWLSHALKPILVKWLKGERALDQVMERSSVDSIAGQYWKTGRLEDAQALLRIFLLDQWMNVFSVKIS